MDKYDKALLNGFYAGLLTQVTYFLGLFFVFLVIEPNDRVYSASYILILVATTWYYFKVLKTDNHNWLSMLMFTVVCGVVSYFLFMNLTFGLFWILLS